MSSSRAAGDRGTQRGLLPCASPAWSGVRVSFFPADPPEDDGVFVEPEPKPWQQPSQVELPQLFPIGKALAVTPSVAIIVAGARVYSDGVEFRIERRIRRGDLADNDWEAVQLRLQRSYYARGDSAGRLRFGVALGDGQHLVLDRGGLRLGDEQPAGHTLNATDSHGGGSPSFQRFCDGLWLWPLPPEGPIEIVAQWPSLGIDESRVAIDSAELRELAGRVRRVWED